jgi:rubrerythrin
MKISTSCLVAVIASGYTMAGEALERCPICGAVHGKFHEF